MHQNTWTGREATQMRDQVARLHAAYPGEDGRDGTRVRAMFSATELVLTAAVEDAIRERVVVPCRRH